MTKLIDWFTDLAPEVMFLVLVILCGTFAGTLALIGWFILILVGRVKP